MTSHRGLRTLATGLVGAALILVGAPAEATHGHLPPGRRIVDHEVRRGETVTALAVRFHAWTDELISFNHLGRSARIYPGQHLRVPVVIAALPHRGHHAHAHRAHHTHRGHHHAHAHRAHRGHRPPSRATVRRVVARTALRHHVDPQLALAIAWQESGWQMNRRSSAGAVGAMQLLPGTGAWMSLYAGHRLRLHRLHDNATAGVTLLRLLAEETTSRRRAIAAYYQGLGAVRSHGLYRESRRYVASVIAIKRRLERGWSPA